MEDKGQHFHQCHAEVKECRLVYLSIQESVGPVAFAVFNSDPLSKVQDRLDVGFEYNGKTQLILLIKN